jgi:hypothetical protein
VTLLAAAGVLMAACNNFDVQNLNSPTAETLTSSPSRDVLARAAVGIQTQAFNDRGAIIQQWGIYGREGWNLLGNDPRETGEEIRGPQDPGGRAGGIWNGQYQAIRTINVYLAALANASALTPAEAKAALGFAETVKAWHLHILAIRSGPTGIPIDVDRPISDPPAPLVSMTDAMAAASALFDKGYAVLVRPRLHGVHHPGYVRAIQSRARGEAPRASRDIHQLLGVLDAGVDSDQPIVHHRDGTPRVAEARRLLWLYGRT